MAPLRLSADWERLPGTSGRPTAVAWADGVSAGTFVDYKAEHTHLTVTDGSITADSSSFDVAPGPLTSFAWSGPGASQTAGVPFGATVTASDAYGNAVSSYTGGLTFVLTGLHSSPNGTPPSYGSVSWSGGVGTFTGITDSDAETTTITAADGTATGTSGSFTVQTADPAKLTFSLQPNDTQQFSNGPSCNSPAVCLIATTIHNEDAFGNLEVNVPVKVTLGQNPGGDVLDGRTNGECSAGTCTATTNGNGDASFTDLTMQKIATGYTLLASSGPTTTQSGPPTATQESGLFNVAQTVKKCNGSCTASASDKFDNITATASGLSGNLSITIETAGLPTSCGITTQVGNLVTVNPTNPTNSPTLEISGALLHKSNGGGVGNAKICKDSGPGTPFHQVPMCNKSDPPCLKKLSGNGQGDIFFDLLVKATKNADGSWTFDPKTGGGI